MSLSRRDLVELVRVFSRDPDYEVSWEHVEKALAGVRGPSAEKGA